VEYTNKAIALPENFICKTFGISYNLIGLTLIDKLPNKELTILMKYLKKLFAFNFLEISYYEIDLSDFEIIMNFFVEKKEITGLDLISNSEVTHCKCNRKMNSEKNNMLRIRKFENLFANINKCFPILTNSIKLKENLVQFRLVHFYGLYKKLIPIFKELQFKNQLSTFIIHSYDSFNKEFSSKVQEVINNLTRLKIICLYQYIIDKENINKLIEAIDKNQNLGILCLTPDNFSQKEYNKFFEYIGIRKNPLSRFYFLNNQYYDFKELYFSKIQENIFYFNKLKRCLRQRNTNMSRLFWEYIKTNLAPTLKIDIKKFNLDSESNKQIFIGKNLEELHINQILLKLLEFKYNLPLDLSKNNLSDSVCFDISKCIIYSKKLDSLNLSENKITDIGCIIIAN